MTYIHGTVTEMIWVYGHYICKPSSDEFFKTAAARNVTGHADQNNCCKEFCSQWVVCNIDIVN